MPDPADFLHNVLEGADEVIIAKEVPYIDWYEKLEIDGKTVIYFGTEESFAEWKKQQVN